MYITTVSSRYRVVIPRQIREQFALMPGQKVAFIPYQRTLRVAILPIIEEAYSFLEGIDTDVARDEEDRV